MGSLKECYSRCEVVLPEDDPDRQHAAVLPAVLEFESENGLLGRDPDQLRNNINDSERFGLISPYTEQADDGKFYLTAELIDSDADIFIDIRMDASSVRVFQKPDDPFEFTTFEALIAHLESAFDCTFDPLSPEEVEDR